MTAIGSEYRPRFHFAGTKLFLPAVCLATIGMRYETFVVIVAVAVIAEKATVLPITAVVTMTEIAYTRIAALTAIFRLLSLRKNELYGRT